MQPSLTANNSGGESFGNHVATFDLETFLLAG